MITKSMKGFLRNKTVQICNIKSIEARVILNYTKSAHIPINPWNNTLSKRYFAGYNKSDNTVDPPKPTTIDEFDKEREEFYRKRNLEVYGKDEYDPYEEFDLPKKETKSERDIKDEAITEFKPQFEAFDTIPQFKTKKEKQEQHRRERNQRKEGQANPKQGFIRYLLNVLSAFSLGSFIIFYLSVMIPYTELKNKCNRLRAHKKVQGVYVNKTKTHTRDPIVIVGLKEGNSMTYPELENFLLKSESITKSKSIDSEEKFSLSEDTLDSLSDFANKTGMGAFIVSTFAGNKRLMVLTW